MDTENKSQLDILLSNLTNKLNDVSALRDPVISKMYDTVMNSKIDYENDSPRMIEVKLQAINTLASLLNSKEGTALNDVRMQLQRKETEANIDHKAATIELLRNINPKSIMGGNILTTSADVTLDDAFTQIEKELEQDNKSIKDSELEMHD